MTREDMDDDEREMWERMKPGSVALLNGPELTAAGRKLLARGLVELVQLTDESILPGMYGVRLKPSPVSTDEDTAGRPARDESKPPPGWNAKGDGWWERDRDCVPPGHGWLAWAHYDREHGYATAPAERPADMYRKSDIDAALERAGLLLTERADFFADLISAAAERPQDAPRSADRDESGPAPGWTVGELADSTAEKRVIVSRAPGGRRCKTWEEAYAVTWALYDAEHEDAPRSADKPRCEAGCDTDSMIEEGVLYHDGQGIPCPDCGHMWSVSCDSETEPHLLDTDDGAEPHGDAPRSAEPCTGCDDLREMMAEACNHIVGGRRDAALELLSRETNPHAPRSEPAAGGDCSHRYVTGDGRGSVQCVDCKAPVLHPSWETERCWSHYADSPLRCSKHAGHDGTHSAGGQEWHGEPAAGERGEVARALMTEAATRLDELRAENRQLQERLAELASTRSLAGSRIAEEAQVFLAALQPEGMKERLEERLFGEGGDDDGTR